MNYLTINSVALIWFYPFFDNEALLFLNVFVISFKGFSDHIHQFDVDLEKKVMSAWKWMKGCRSIHRKLFPWQETYPTLYRVRVSIWLVVANHFLADYHSCMILSKWPVGKIIFRSRTATEAYFYYEHQPFFFCKSLFTQLRFFVLVFAPFLIESIFA